MVNFQCRFSFVFILGFEENKKVIKHPPLLLNIPTTQVHLAQLFDHPNF